MTFHSSLSISPLVNTPWSFNESTSNLSHDFESSPCSFLYLVDYIVPYSYCKLTIIFSIPNSTCQSSILFLVRIYILRLKKVHSDFLRNTPYYIYTTKRSYSQLYRRITNLENLPELALMTKMPAGKEAKSKCASPPWKLAEATFAPEAV